MKHFVIGYDAKILTPQEQVAVAEYFKARFAYWHWFEDFWLVRSSQDLINAVQIRDALKSLTSDKWVIVLQVKPAGDWAAYGNAKWTEWITEYWKP